MGLDSPISYSDNDEWSGISDDKDNDKEWEGFVSFENQDKSTNQDDAGMIAIWNDVPELISHIAIANMRLQIDEEKTNPSVQNQSDEDIYNGDSDNQEEEEIRKESADNIFDDDQSSVGSELEAQWAMADDPEIAQLEYFISKSDEFGYFRQKLAEHLAFKKSYPQDAIDTIRKKKRSLAMNISHRFTTEEWYEAIGEDNIPSPPHYSIGSWIVKKTYSRPIDHRLDGWAKYDPEGKDPNNPLRSSKAAEY